VALLAAAKETDLSQRRGAYATQSSILGLSRAIVNIAPEEAQQFLLNVALKSNHYYDSIEFLASYLAQRSLEPTLKLAEEHYHGRKNWPNDQYFLRAVLIELSKTDLKRAKAGIDRMQDPEREVAAVKLAEFLLRENRRKETQEMIGYILLLHPDFNYTIRSLKKLREGLAKTEGIPDKGSGPSENFIEEFLNDPDAQVNSIWGIRRVTFKSKKQALEFVKKA
jgi:hypothetical protein